MNNLTIKRVEQWAPHINTDVSLDDGYTTWNEGCFTEVNCMRRRPYPCANYANKATVGSLKS